MSKQISVRVSRTKLIASLSKAIAKLNAEKDSNKVQQNLRDKWEARSKKIPLTSYAKVAHKTEISIDDNPWRGDNDIKVSVEYYIRKNVAEDKLAYVQPVSENWRNDTIIEEIGQAIRLLELSDEDTVNTATYRSVTQYL